METVDTLGVLQLAWPHIGLGAGIVIIILMFTSDAFRSDTSRSRWRDPVWLAWAIVAAYLLHVFEEYGAWIANGQFVLVTTFEETGVSDMFGGIPHYFFPLVNILFTWVALPIAALIARRNPVVGLSALGFVLVNSLTHLGGGAMSSGNPFLMPGSINGIVVSLLLVGWIVYACIKYKLLPRKGLAIAITAGVLGHIGLFSIYLMNLGLGSVAVTVWTPVVVFLPILTSWLLCKAFFITFPKESA
jgi:hypothetical protein